MPKLRWRSWPVCLHAYTLNLDKTPYEVLYGAHIGDVTCALSEADAIVVYGTSKLERVSPNEYWFKTPPVDAALLIFSVGE